MKNSTDKKKNRFIRIEAIAPLAIILAIVMGYFVLFFDGHLRRGLQWAATQLNEAEVNVGYLKTSFVQGKLNMGKLEATDPKAPNKNWIQLGEIEFKFSWDALLRGKFVVDIAAVKNVEIDTPRRSPGKLVPPPKEGEPPSFIKKWTDKVSGKAISQAGEMLGGMDPTKNLKIDPAQMKSAQKVKELKADLANQDQKWAQALNKMPSSEELTALQNKIAGIKGGGANPAEIQSKIAQVTEAIKESENKVNAVKSQGTAVAGEISGFGNSISKIDDLAKEDRAEMEKALKLPAIDTKSMGLQLFGGSALSKVGQAQKAVKEARSYMPAKAADKPTPPPIKRAKGRDFEFPTQGSYPAFWLKRLEISGSGVGGEKIEGELTDVTSNPALIFRPTVGKLSADLPKHGIKGFKAFMVLDHTTALPQDTFKAKIEEFPLSQQMFSESDQLKFGFSKANGAGEIEGSMKGEKVEILGKAQISQADYLIQAKTKMLEEIVQRAVKEAAPIYVTAKAMGTLEDLDLSIDTNLASALQKGFEAQLKAKLDEARSKIDQMIQSNIGAQKAELTKQFEEKKAKAFAVIEERKKQAEGVQKMASSKLNEVKSQAGNVQQKAVDAIRKGLPF